MIHVGHSILCAFFEHYGTVALVLLSSTNTRTPYVRRSPTEPLSPCSTTIVLPHSIRPLLIVTDWQFFFFFLTKEYIHAIPHSQPWLHGAYLQSIDTTTTLMKLFLLAYRPQVMTELYSYQYLKFLILITITTTSALLPYPSHPHPIMPHGGEVVPQATLENV